jgi:hypothetical protein
VISLGPQPSAISRRPSAVRRVQKIVPGLCDPLEDGDRWKGTGGRHPVRDLPQLPSSWARVSPGSSLNIHDVTRSEGRHMGIGRWFRRTSAENRPLALDVTHGSSSADGSCAHKRALLGQVARPVSQFPVLAESDLAQKLGRIGYFFVTTAEIAGAVDVARGPKAPPTTLDFNRAWPLVPPNDWPLLYEPEFLDRICSAALGRQDGATLRVVSRSGRGTLYQVSPAVTDVLARLTSDLPTETLSVLGAIADTVYSAPEVKNRVERGGVAAAAMILRCRALEALPRDAKREVYYWFWREPAVDGREGR